MKGGERCAGLIITIITVFHTSVMSIITVYIASIITIITVTIIATITNRIITITIITSIIELAGLMAEVECHNLEQGHKLLEIYPARVACPSIPYHELPREP